MIRDDFESALSDSVCSLFAHVWAVYVPLRLQQGLHDVFGTTEGAGTQTGLQANLKTSHYAERNPQTQIYLQTGTTMGLSLISLNWPLSFSACSTAFLASNLFMPFGMDRMSKKRKSVLLWKSLVSQQKHPDSMKEANETPLPGREEAR